MSFQHKYRFIQIDRAGVNNKGDALMLCAIQEKLREILGPEVRFVLGRQAGPFQDLDHAAYGLYKVFDVSKYKIPLAPFIPAKQLMRFGLVKKSMVSDIIETGGFQFGDQWSNFYSPAKNKKLSSHFRWYKKRGSKIIFMPQAYGPFEKDISKDRIKRVLEFADLVYARDQRSLEYLQMVFGKDERIKLSPDFSVLSEGYILKEQFEKVKNRICLIPNVQMINKSVDKNEAKAYLDMMSGLMKYFKKSDIPYFILNHEGVNDYGLIEKLCESSEATPLIYNNLHPKNIKGIIAASTLVISSRFHGVVNALCQQVPVLASTWSHKYSELMTYYGQENYVLNNKLEEVIEKVNFLLNVSNRTEVSATLKEPAEKHRKEVIQMWDTIAGIIKK